MAFTRKHGSGIRNGHGSIYGGTFNFRNHKMQAVNVSGKSQLDNSDADSSGGHEQKAKEGYGMKGEG